MALSLSRGNSRLQTLKDALKEQSAAATNHDKLKSVRPSDVGIIRAGQEAGYLLHVISILGLDACAHDKSLMAISHLETLIYCPMSIDQSTPELSNFIEGRELLLILAYYYPWCLGGKLFLF